MSSLWTMTKTVVHVTVITAAVSVVASLDAEKRLDRRQRSNLSMDTTQFATPRQSGSQLSTPQQSAADALAEFRSLLSSINDPAVQRSSDPATAAFAPFSSAAEESDQLTDLFAAFKESVEQAAAERGFTIPDPSLLSLPSNEELNR